MELEVGQVPASSGTVLDQDGNPTAYAGWLQLPTVTGTPAAGDLRIALTVAVDG